MRLAAIVLLGVTVAGCDGAKAPASQPSAAATPSKTESKILALSDVQRRVAFLRGILDADYDCRKVTAVESKPRDSDGHLVYHVTCDNAADYTLTVMPDDTFNVSGVPRGDGPRFPKATATAAPVPSAR